MSDPCTFEELQNWYEEQEVEITELKERITELERGIKISLFGTPIDSYGNLDDDGLYGYPNIERIRSKLSVLVPDSTRTTFGEELEGHDA